MSAIRWDSRGSSNKGGWGTERCIVGDAMTWFNFKMKYCTSKMFDEILDVGHGEMALSHIGRQWTIVWDSVCVFLWIVDQFHVVVLCWKCTTLWNSVYNRFLPLILNWEARLGRIGDEQKQMLILWYETVYVHNKYKQKSINIGWGARKKVTLNRKWLKMRNCVSMRSGMIRSLMANSEKWYCRD